MENIFLVTAVVATVEFLRRVKVSDYFAAITILAAGAIGVAAGLLGAPGVADAWDGLVMGLSASGLVTVATRV